MTHQLKSKSPPDDECCPKFHPERWESKEFEWKEKPFVRESVPALFHIPFAPMIKRKITKMMKLISQANQEVPEKAEALVLFRDPTPFKSEIYISTTGRVPGANNIYFSGTMAAKVYEGTYREIPKLIKRIQDHLADDPRGKNLKGGDYYVHYAYCPRCQIKHGHNYVVFFVKLA